MSGITVGKVGANISFFSFYLFYQPTVHFMEELQKLIPNSEIRERKGLELKRIIPQAKERDFTAIVVVNEDKKKPSILS